MSAAAVAVSCIHYDFTENVLKQSDLKQIVEKVASDYSIVFFFSPEREYRRRVNFQELKRKQKLAFAGKAHSSKEVLSHEWVAYWTFPFFNSYES